MYVRQLGKSTTGLERVANREIILKVPMKVWRRINPELEAKIHQLSDTEIGRLSDDLVSKKKITDLEELFRVRRRNSDNWFVKEW